MATKWNDLNHKATPEKRKQLKQEALAELDAMERTGVAVLRSSDPGSTSPTAKKTVSVITKLPLH